MTEHKKTHTSHSSTKSSSPSKEDIRQAVVDRNKQKITTYGKSFGKPILEQPDVSVEETMEQIFNMLKKDDHPHLGPILLDLATKL